MEIYLVGGAVRDELLGLSVKDRDWVVVGATPQAMEAQGFKPVGADFPVFLHPETHEEYALARTERKQGHGYHGFTVYSEPDVTLEDDLGRRDLTINAMARSQSGQLIDPYGGRRDLEDRCLRHVSPAFSEDPLRILRTARFASRFAPQGFTVAEETMTLMQGMVASGEVDHLVPERVWQETQRALHEQAPAVYFRVLEACGALARVMPELVTLSESGLTAMTRASDAGAVTAVVYAALVHDRPQEAIESLSQRLKVPNDCQTLARLNRSFCERFASAEPSVERVMAQLDEGDAWRRPERFEQLLQAAAHSGVDESLVDRVRQCHAAAASVDPQELMALGFKGKALGEAIQRERAERVRQSLV